ncbi:MAG: PLP-dependent aminotransferase family protein [Thiohalomonadales bacterium]
MAIKAGKKKAKSETYLYRQIAQDTIDAIQRDDYSVGDRLPSLRAVCKIYAVSLATAVQAYQLLYDQGWASVRHKSGYRAKNPVIREITAPEVSRPHFKSMKANVSEMAMSLVSEVRQKRLIKLGAAVPQPSLLPLSSLARTMAGCARRHYLDVAAYTDYTGYRPLRQQIVRLMHDAGVRCHSDDIIITNGCLEALNLALRAVATPGDSVAIESPTYFGILQIIEALGLRALELPTHVTLGIDLAALEVAIQKKSLKACVLMPSFANPTGSMMPVENRRSVVELLARHQIPLIEDDVYGVLSYTNHRPRALKSYDAEQNVIYCSSFSKTIAPGLRVGWILPGRLMERIGYLKFLDNIGNAIHPQMALAELLAKGSYRRNIRHAAMVYRHRMGRLREWVSRYFPEGTRISDPQGGFLLWVELPETVDSFKLYHAAMEHNIAITPGILFSVQSQYTNHIRLSCGAVEDDVAERSIKKLATLMMGLHE